MKLKPLNNYVLLKSIDEKKNIDFYESENGGNTLDAYEIFSVPDKCELEGIIGKTVYIDSSKLTSKKVDDIEYHIARMDDLCFIKEK
jgi:co-chaperonin GroES (HSP10)